MSGNQDNAKKAYILIGASGGIGACVARELTSRGHRVLLASRASERLDVLAGESRQPSMPVGAASFQEIGACCEEEKTCFGRLDGAIRCVGHPDVDTIYAWRKLGNPLAKTTGHRARQSPRRQQFTAAQADRGRIGFGAITSLGIHSAEISRPQFSPANLVVEPTALVWPT